MAFMFESERRVRGIAALAALAMFQLAAQPVQAQLPGGLGGNALGGLGGGLPSVTQAGPANTAASTCIALSSTASARSSTRPQS